MISYSLFLILKALVLHWEIYNATLNGIYATVFASKNRQLVLVERIRLITLLSGSIAVE